MIEFVVHGDPKPQGSKRHIGRGILVESSKGLKDWRTDVAFVAREHSDEDPLDGPLYLSLAFSLRRPKAGKRTRPTTRPDIDKLARGVLDALQIGGLIRDDSCVVTLVCTKHYEGEVGLLPGPGVLVKVGAA